MKNTTKATTGTVRINGVTLEVEIKGKTVRYTNGTDQCEGCGQNVADTTRWAAHRLGVVCECGAEYSLTR